MIAESVFNVCMAGIINAKILFISIPTSLFSSLALLNFSISVFSDTKTFMSIDAFIFSFMILFSLSLNFCSFLKSLNLFFIDRKSVIMIVGTVITMIVASLVFVWNISAVLPTSRSRAISKKLMLCTKEFFTCTVSLFIIVNILEGFCCSR